MLTDDAFVKALLPAQIEEPANITFNRLEARPRSGNFERSLQAEVRDALWMLARQWQLGEFQGNDAAYAVQGRAHVESSRLTRVSRRGGEAIPYDEAVPLEAFVEGEAIPVDLRLRLEMGLRWLRLLQHFKASATAEAIFRGAYPLEMPTYPTAPNADAPDAQPFA